MLSNKIIAVCLRPKISSYTSLRLLRGGYTFELKKQKSKIKESKEQQQRRLREIDRSNVGIGKTLFSIQKHGGKLDPDLSYEDIENAATSLENYESKLNENLKSSYAEFDRKSLNNIKRKYFKEPKLPNMVPYCEKQDMKLLHENDPDNWDIEKLAESFPVTPEIAKKILRSPFTAHTVEQVRKHDEIVKRNWKLFKEGKLDLPLELRTHYEKFVNRVSFETRENVIKKYLPPEPNFELNLKLKEFGSIIEKYQQTKATKVQIDQENNTVVFEDIKAEPKMITEQMQRSSTNSVTLEKLRKNIKQNPNQASELSKMIVEMEKKYLPVSKPEVPMVPESDYLADAEVVDKTYEHSLSSVNEVNDDFPLRIRIPKNKWKRNKIYQVKDRFYNDAGCFLYRVPGLFN